MENFLNFVKEYYLFFTIISAILILSLIGFLAEKNISKDVKIKQPKLAKNTSKEVNMATSNGIKNEEEGV